ncbi:MAG: HAD hydrolase-like protein [Planctomycetota bacterium]
MSESVESGLPALVVFDLAGTTVIDRKIVFRSFRSALEELEVEVDEEQIREVMGLAKPEAIERLLRGRSPRDQLQERITAIHAAFRRRVLEHYRQDPSVGEVPGTSEVFRWLQDQGVRIGLDTGFDRGITNVVLDRMGWERRALFDASITSDEVALGRPHPDMIQRLMQRFRIEDPARVAKVGDTPVDMEEGRNVGCGWIVGVTSGSGSKEELEAAGATHVIPSVRDLPSLLGG